MAEPEIPTLPVLVPLTLAAFAVVLWWLRRHSCLTVLRAALAGVTCVYGAAVLSHTMLPFELGRDGQPWHVWLNLTPFVDAADDPIGIVLNVALFVPLGFLLPLIAPTRSTSGALGIGLAVSLSIEIVQFAADLTISTGRVADIDDLVGNTAGAVLGYAVLRLFMIVPVFARAARHVALPSSWVCRSARGTEYTRTGRSGRP